MRNRFYRPVEIYLIWNKKKLSSIPKTQVQYLCLIHLSLISGGGFLWLLWVAIKTSAGKQGTEINCSIYS